MEGKLEKTLDNCLNTLYETIKTIKMHNEREDFCSEFKEIGKEYALNGNEFKRAAEALRKTKEYFKDQNNDISVSVKEIYQSNLKASNINYEENEIWKNVAKTLNFNFNEDEGNTSVGDTIICSGKFSITTDPISKMKIRKPCRNTICKHVYDYETVMSFIKGSKNKKKIRCPYMGCVNDNLNADHIVIDKNLLEEMDTDTEDDVFSDATL